MVTLYSIGCGKCIVLEKKLKQAGIEFEVCDDREVIEDKGFDYMPVLEVDDKTMQYDEAIKWVDERSKS